MRERINTFLAVLGIVGILASAFVIYDRFWQHSRPNIPKFERELSSDYSSDDLYKFLRQNYRKNIFLSIDLNDGDGPYGLRVNSKEIPSSGQAFEFSFIGDCDQNSPPKRDSVMNGDCNEIIVFIEAAPNVEKQVFNPHGAIISVQGYFFNSLFESHMGSQRFTLRPISAQQVQT
jgi:hypothetical protein